MSKYYYLIAGLPEIQPDDAKLTLKLQELHQILQETLTAKDYAIVSHIFQHYEALNWLAFLKDRDAALHPLGISTSDQFEEVVTLLKETEYPKINSVPGYFPAFAYAYWEDKPLFNNLSWNDQLMSLYYKDALRCGNPFVRTWFEFCLNINNLLTAYTCRKYNFDMQSSIVGDNVVARTLKASHARDFGVSDFFPQADQVLRIAEEGDLLEREKKIDLLKWQWIEESTVFEYFTIEAVAAYLMKLEIVERWLPLKQEAGAAIFRELIKNLKSGVQFPSEK
jgi:Protein of unknown function (DUF2764).